MNLSPGDGGFYPCESVLVEAASVPPRLRVHGAVFGHTFDAEHMYDVTEMVQGLADANEGEYIEISPEVNLCQLFGDPHRCSADPTAML